MNYGIKKIIVVAFVLLLVIPNFIMLTGLERGLVNNENRAFTSIPIFNSSSPMRFIGEFKNYYLENFGSKTFFVNNYIEFKNNVLIENPIPHRVLKGKNNHYFLGNQFNKVLNNSFGNDPLSKKELNEITKNITEISSYLKSQNIDFYVVIPPDKHNAYKEYLPFKLSQKERKLQKIKAHLKQSLDFEIIDLTNIILENKHIKELYIKSDSHWNDYGAFLGYTEIMKVLNKKYSFPTVDSTDYFITNTFKKIGGNTKTINFFPQELDVVFKKKPKENYQVIYRNRKDIIIENPSQDDTILFYGDSFSNNLVKFFGESFKRVSFLRGYQISKSLVEKEKPKVVIFEVIERNIDAVLAKEKPLMK